MLRLVAQNVNSPRFVVTRLERLNGMLFFFEQALRLYCIPGRPGRKDFFSFVFMGMHTHYSVDVIVVYQTQIHQIIITWHNFSLNPVD